MAVDHVSISEVIYHYFYTFFISFNKKCIKIMILVNILYFFNNVCTILINF